MDIKSEVKNSIFSSISANFIPKISLTMLHAFKLLFQDNNKSNLSARNREIVTRLKFMGTLKVGQKVDPPNLSVESNNIFTPFKRMMFGISRDTVLLFFSETIDRTFEIIRSYCNSKHVSEKIFCSNVIHDLIRATDGLKHQQQTYVNDAMFVCEIETLIESIHGVLFEIQQNNPDIMTFKELHILELTGKNDRDDRDDREHDLLNASPDLRTQNLLP